MLKANTNNPVAEATSTSPTLSPMQKIHLLFKKGLRPSMDKDLADLFNQLDDATKVEFIETSFVTYPLNNGIKVKNTAFGVSANEGCILFVAEMLKISKKAINVAMESETPAYHGLTALSAAILEDSLAMAELLLEHGASLLGVDGEGNNDLMRIQSKEMLELLIHHARKNDCLHEYLTHENNDKRMVLSTLCRANVAVFTALIDLIGIENLEQYVTTQNLLFQIFYSYFRDSKNSAAYFALAQKVWPLKTAANGIASADSLPFGHEESLELIEVGLAKSQDKEITLFFNLLDNTTKLKLANTALTDDSSDLKLSIFSCSVLKNHILFVTEMLKVTKEPIHFITHASNPKFDGVGTLFFALMDNRLTMAQLLLENGANLLTVNSLGNNYLIEIQSKEMLELIINYAQKNACLSEFLTHKNNNKQVAIETLASTNPQMLGTLIDLISAESLGHYIDVGSLIHVIRLLYFVRHNEAATFDTLAQKFRPIVPHSKDPLSYATRPLILEGYGNFSLFKEQRQSPTTKKIATRNALAQIYELFHDPERCIKYLKFIDKEFSRYFEETHHKKFPSLDANTYHFNVIDYHTYPTPKDNYQPLVKHHALQEFLLLFIRQYGIAEKTHKWIGFVPRAFSKETLARGDFFTEDRYGEGLFHNKITHMLQQAIILCAMDDNKIDLKYRTAEGEENLSIHDILTATMNEKTHGTKQSVWTKLRDTLSRESVNFSDPLRLGSCIMKRGHALGIPTLADAMIDSYCKGLLKLVNAYKETGKYPDLTVQNFVNKMDDIRTHLFSGNTYLFNYAMEKERAKASKVLDTNNKTYAIIEKSYKPNPSFQARTYSDKQEEEASFSNRR